MHELTEIMRQRGDSTFCELLCCVRTDECTDEDIAVLQTAPDNANYPTQALHVYRLNVDVDNHNTSMLNSLAPQNSQYTIKAHDAAASQTSHINLSSLSVRRNETGGLHTVLKLAVGARVMLTTNINVSDGLVNGARGDVLHIVTNSNNEVSTVLVNFDSDQVGTAAIQTSPHRSPFPNAIPIRRHEVVFFANKKQGSEITRAQFPAGYNHP